LKIGHQDRFYSIDSEYDAVREFLQITISVGGIENWMFLGKTENSSQRIPDFRSHAATQTLWVQNLLLSSRIQNQNSIIVIHQSIPIRRIFQPATVFQFPEIPAAHRRTPLVRGLHQPLQPRNKLRILPRLGIEPTLILRKKSWQRRQEAQAQAQRRLYFL
jgi:hypothetical protein